MEDIGPRIREEQTRVEKIHPLEAKRNCDAIDRSLQTVEETARSAFRDIQMLQEGRFATSDQLYRRSVILAIVNTQIFFVKGSTILRH